MKFEDLIGKTIISATIMKKLNYDDNAWLKLEFSDNSSCILFGCYSGYTGLSEDEYPAYINICGGGDIKGLIPVK